MSYEERHPQQTSEQIPWDHPIRLIMRDVCNLPDHPYDPNNPELMLIEYDELLAILEDKLLTRSPQDHGSSHE